VCSSDLASNATATSLTLSAANTGPGGNAIGVSTGWSGALFAGGALAGGVNAVAATGTLSVTLPTPSNGQTVTVGGTTYTFTTSPLAGNSPADTVMVGADVQSTLANLMAAINFDPSQKGTAYSSATTAANTSAIASNPTASSLTLTAIPIGATGNGSIGTSTD